MASEATAPTSTTVYQQALPEYAAPYFERLLQRAETESLQGYQPYTGARLAGFTEAERAAQAGLAGLSRPEQFAAATGVAARAAQEGPSAFDYARGYTPGAFTAAYTPAGITSGYQAGAGPAAYEAGILGGMGPFTQEIASRYMTPYQEAVTSAAVRELEKGAERARTGIGQAAAQAGGRGGYREALERSELQRNVLEQVGDVTAKGRAAAYESAMQQYERDRQAQLAGFQTQEAARQAAAASGLAGYQAQEAARQAQTQFGLTAQQATEQQRQAAAELAARQEAAREAARQQQTTFGLQGLQQDLAARQQQLAAAQTLGELGRTQQAMDIERLGQQESVGQRQRALNQASLDIGYQDFLNQMGYTQGQLGFFSNILRGIPVQPQQTVSTFQQQPSLFQSVLGAGIGGLGLYNALKGGG
jgi:hypothetical protein